MLEAEAQPAPEAGRRDFHQLVLTGRLRFALRFSEAREYVAGVSGLVPVPRSPRWLLGLFSADGTATPLVDIESWARPGSLPAPLEAGCNALRLSDGPDSWAIRLAQSPTVMDLAGHRRETVGVSLPLAVSAAYGGLMSHATELIHLEAGHHAMRIHWKQLADQLRQELSGMEARELTTT